MPSPTYVKISLFPGRLSHWHFSPFNIISYGMIPSIWRNKFFHLRPRINSNHWGSFLHLCTYNPNISCRSFSITGAILMWTNWAELGLIFHFSLFGYMAPTVSSWILARDGKVLELSLHFIDWLIVFMLRTKENIIWLGTYQGWFLANIHTGT